MVTKPQGYAHPSFPAFGLVFPDNHIDGKDSIHRSRSKATSLPSDLLTAVTEEQTPFFIPYVVNEVGFSGITWNKSLKVDAGYVLRCFMV